MKILSALLLAVGLVTCPTAFAAEQGQSAPPCTAHLAAKPTNLDFTAYKGKVVLVDFWATWCGPCMKSMPFFNQLQNQMPSDKFQIVAVNVDEDPDGAREFLKQHPVDYPIAYDPNGSCPNAFQVKAMPSTYLIDKAGKVRYVHLGYREEDRSGIQEKISGLMAE